jgi:hypothetical protein
MFPVLVHIISLCTPLDLCFPILCSLCLPFCHLTLCSYVCLCLSSICGTCTNKKYSHVMSPKPRDIIHHRGIYSTTRRQSYHSDLPRQAVQRQRPTVVLLWTYLSIVSSELKSRPPNTSSDFDVELTVARTTRRPSGAHRMVRRSCHAAGKRACVEGVV